MHPPEVRQEAKKLIAAGVNDCEVSRRLGVPRTTVREWRRPVYVKKGRADWGPCPRCWRDGRNLDFSSKDYAELLGLYLGDGYINLAPRTQKLRIHYDTKYPGLIDEGETLIERVLGSARHGRVIQDQGSMAVVWVHSNHLTCLFPQHGSGKKHLRDIELEPWQWAHVRRAPYALLRGLIRSDGCVFINRTGPYEYESYDFSNHSQDILDLFVAACEMVGVECRRNTLHVRINKRASVAKMLEHVGRKY